MRPLHISNNDHDPRQVLQHLKHRWCVAHEPQTLPNLPPAHNITHHTYNRYFQPRRALLHQCFSEKGRHYDLEDALRLTCLPGHRIGDWRGRF